MGVLSDGRVGAQVSQAADFVQKTSYPEAHGPEYYFDIALKMS
jgi:hypothetical protein